MDASRPPDQATKILEQEAGHLRSRVADLSRRLDTPAEAIEAAVEVLNLRSRYFGVTGEHFGVQDLEGIQIIDALDEQLLRAVRDLLKKFVGHHRRTPDLQALSTLTEKLSPFARDLPQFPVAYMVLYVIRAVFEKIPTVMEGGRHAPSAVEHALVHHLLGLVDRYVQTRERPVVRHYSDVAREYSVVSRLKCACGDEKFEVKMQSLCQRSDGAPYDKLDLACRSCGAQRTITFDLPHFKDMYRI